MMPPRRGFALLTLLWVLVSAAALTTIVTQIGRDSYNAARNRINAERATWLAEDCLARTQATMDSLISNVANDPALGSSLWRALDTAVMNRGTVTRPNCSVVMEATGSRIDINGDTTLVGRALGAIAGAGPSASLLSALGDWRDADSVARPLGAEATWYSSQGRFHPRNDSIAHLRELPRIRGFENLTGLEHVFGVEPGRISIANAPSAVLAAVPGFTVETVALIKSWRAKGVQVNDVTALLGSLTQPSADILLANFAAISRLTVLDPEAWIVRAVGVAGMPAESVWVDVRVVRTQDRAVVVRRRSWM